MFEWVQFSFPSRIFIERDCTHKIGSMVKDMGQRVLILSVRGEQRNSDELAVIRTSLEKHTNGCILYDDMNLAPGPQELDTAAYFLRQCKADFVLAYGSRQTFNAARVMALLATNDVFAEDLPQATFPLKKAPLPVACVPVGPSMGEEASASFTLFNPETHSTFSASDYRLFPAMVFVDPNISLPTPMSEITRAGVAIMAAAVETMLARKANEISTAMALRALELAARNVITLAQEPANNSARFNLCLASLMAGMAHSNSRLGLCYSIAEATYHLTGLDFFMSMAIMLPHVMEYNLTTSAGKYVQIARALEEDIQDITVIEAAIKAVEGVRKVYLELKIPQRLSDFEVKKSDLPSIAEMAYMMPLSRNTPRDMDRNEIETVLIAAY
ncbi:MAG: iron-containing alcohol dehydrogenase [Spirochaetales bacterium]|nr:iron-containing alcohol dehydrogenase [Spirochaetales bacterium]